MKIVLVAGCRPNFVKVAPLLREMDKHPEIESLLVHTGQHYDPLMSDVFFRDLSIRRPDFSLGVGNGSHAHQTGEIMKRFEDYIRNERPDIVLVVGDVNSTMATAITAAKMNIPVAHVEAGLRSGDRSMPEEINRILTDSISTYLFASELQAVFNLRDEGHSPESIHWVGNVMVDSVYSALERLEGLEGIGSTIIHDLGLSPKAKILPYAVLTLHRPSNVDNLKTLDGIMFAVTQISQDIPIVFPIHPRTRKHLVPEDYHLARVMCIEPLGYLDNITLLSQAKLVLTDSGGIQEETTALGVPCLTLRKETERWATVSDGTNRIVGTEPEVIKEFADKLLDGTWKTPQRIPQLWDGHASERIVAALLREGF